ncbi:MAG: hypothetical protein A4E26_00416 [Methanobacterium sp. PtaU1.Bin097]|jgi:hypothetical protein|nr:MAG: hypothetical protein A4E26_00416 [Methanobacterium sp. PtaU1.Bin097]
MKKDIVHSFVKNIELMDRYRYYYSNMNRVSFFERQKLSKMVDNNLREYDRFLWARVQGESEEIVTPKQSESNNNYFFAAFISYLLCVMVFATFARVYFFQGAVFIGFISILGFLILLVALVFKIAVPRWKWSFRKIFKLRNLVQELINDAIEFFREGGLDPENYPLALNFNDYNGLKQIKEEKKLLSKNYIFYLNLNVINTSKFIEEEISEEKVHSAALRFFIKALILGALFIVVIFSLVILLHRFGILKL